MTERISLLSPKDFAIGAPIGLDVSLVKILFLCMNDWLSLELVCTSLASDVIFLTVVSSQSNPRYWRTTPDERRWKNNTRSQRRDIQPHRASRKRWNWREIQDPFRLRSYYATGKNPE